MSDTNAESIAPQDGAESSKPNEKQQSAPAKPPWGDKEYFDPDRAWSLIQNLRIENGQLKTDRDSFKLKVDEHESGKKTIEERLTADRDGHKSRADAAEAKLLRLDVGAEKGLTTRQATRQAMRLTGSLPRGAGGRRGRPAGGLPALGGEREPRPQQPPAGGLPRRCR